MGNQGFWRENSNCKQTAADKSKQTADENVNKQLTYVKLWSIILTKDWWETKVFGAKIQIRTLMPPNKHDLGAKIQILNPNAPNYLFFKID